MAIVELHAIMTVDWDMLAEYDIDDDLDEELICAIFMNAMKFEIVPKCEEE